MVDENVRVFPADLGFRRSGTPERRNPTKTKVVPYHMYTNVFCVLNVQYPTPGCDRLHRLHFLSSEFLHLEVKTPVSGESYGILCLFGVDFGFPHSYE